jgi:hypothetical protein
LSTTVYARISRNQIAFACLGIATSSMLVFEAVHTRGVPGSHGRTPTFINIKPQARANKPRAKPNPVQNNSRSTADINIYHTEIIWWSHCNANGAAFATFIYVRFGSTKHLTATCCNYMTHVATVANPGSASQLNLVDGASPVIRVGYSGNVPRYLRELQES